MTEPRRDDQIDVDGYEAHCVFHPGQGRRSSGVAAQGSNADAHLFEAVALRGQPVVAKPKTS